MMKILHILTTLTYGGIETMIVNMVNVQSEYANVYLLIINRDISEELIDSISSKVNVIRFNRIPHSKYITTGLRVNYLIFKIHPNIIHIHIIPLIRLIPLFLRSKTCCTVHGIMNFDKNLYSYKHIFSVSQTTKLYLEKYKVSSTVIYNGIPTHLFKAKKEYHRNRTFRIINIGRLSQTIKRQDILIKAAYILKRQGIDNINIDIVGTGESLAMLKEMAKSLNVENIINFTGNHTQSYIQEHLAEYDLMINCSLSESFGLTVAEGMSAKIPVLVSSNTGSSEVINFGEYGFIFENGNAEDCANKIQYIMSLSDNELNNMTMAAYDYVKSSFDITKTAINYLKAYSKIQ